jgi:predicted aminopeptidase
MKMPKGKPKKPTQRATYETLLARDLNWAWYHAYDQNAKAPSRNALTYRDLYHKDLKAFLDLYGDYAE